MGKDTGGPSGNKRSGGSNSTGKKSKDDKIGPCSRRGSKDKKPNKIVHTFNIADKNKSNNKSTVSSPLGETRITPIKIVLARAKRLRARQENRSEGLLELSKEEKLKLEKRGYIISNNVGRNASSLKFRVHYLKDSETSILRRKYDLWGKMVKESDEDAASDLKYREIKILLKLNHRNLVQLHSVLRWNGKIFLFTTGGMYGSVLDFVAYHGPILEDHGRVWFRQILNGLEYMYGENISHRDINCETLMLGNNYHILIGDFGCATITSYDNSNALSTLVNKSLYSAPEVLLGEPYNPRISDMWSVGVVLYSMYLGHPPFRHYGNEDRQIAKLIIDQVQMVWLHKADSRKLSPSSWKVICSLLEPDFLKRATLRFLKQSQFYSMKECVCGHGSLKALSLDILGSLPDLYTTVKPSQKSKTEGKSDSKTLKVICPAFKEFASPKKELSLKIEDVEQSPTLITISEESAPYCP